jgi:hypothetical protein
MTAQHDTRPLGCQEEHCSLAFCPEPGLNYGDCFSYVLAISTGEPLLFKGDDFVHTDVTMVDLGSR